MFCPQCHSEYESGILTCGECEVPLVEALTEAPLPEVTHTVEAFFCSDRGQLAVAESILRASGIPYAVPGLDRWSIYSGARCIRVPQEHLDHAVELLSGLSQTDPDSDADGDDSDLGE